MMFKFGLLFVMMMAWYGATMSMNHTFTPTEIENISNGVYWKIQNNTFKAQGDDVNATFLERALGKYGDLIFYLGATAEREGIMYGYNHPTKTYKYVMWFIFISMMAPLIIPLIYVIGFVVLGAQWAYQKLKGVRE